MERGTGSSGSFFTGQLQAFLTPPACRNGWVYPSSPPYLGMSHLTQTTRGYLHTLPGNGPPHRDHTGSVHTLPWEWPSSPRSHGVSTHPAWEWPSSPRSHGVSTHPAEFFTTCLYPWVAHHPGLSGLLLLRESLTWLLINFWLSCIPFLLDCYITWTYVSFAHYF